MKGEERCEKVGEEGRREQKMKKRGGKERERDMGRRRDEKKGGEWKCDKEML